MPTDSGYRAGVESGGEFVAVLRGNRPEQCESDSQFQVVKLACTKNAACRGWSDRRCGHFHWRRIRFPETRICAQRVCTLLLTQGIQFSLGWRRWTPTTPVPLGHALPFE